MAHNVLRQYALHVLFVSPPPSSDGTLNNTAAPVHTPFPFVHKPNTLDDHRIVMPVGWDSWDLTARGGVERDKSDLLRRVSSRVDVGQRASSSMLLRERERERTVDLEDGALPSQAQAQATQRLYTPGLQRESTPASATLDQEDSSPSQAQQPSTARRLYTPGLQRDISASASASAKPGLVTIESQRSLHIEDDYEPSPTPTLRPRPSQSIDESSMRNNNKLPQSTTAPHPRPTLPSETTARQQDKATTSRRAAATASTTMCANPGMTITTPSAAPTTAITHTTRRDPHARPLLPIKSFTLKRTRVLTRAACGNHCTGL